MISTCVYIVWLTKERSFADCLSIFSAVLHVHVYTPFTCIYAFYSLPTITRKLVLVVSLICQCKVQFMYKYMYMYRMYMCTCIYMHIIHAHEYSTYCTQWLLWSSMRTWESCGWVQTTWVQRTGSTWAPYYARTTLWECSMSVKIVSRLAPLYWLISVHVHLQVAIEKISLTYMYKS